MSVLIITGLNRCIKRDDGKAWCDRLDAKGLQVMPIFTRFTNNFFRLIWKFRSIFLTLLAFLTGGALMIAYAENLPF